MFELSVDGWSARWQGAEDDTHFDVAYKAATGRWEIRQTWRGLDGGFCLFPARMPLDQVITQALYRQFPSSWDSAAKSQLESAYQLTVIEQSENAHAFFGIPDGAFRTIAFPIAVRNLRIVRQWLQGIVDESPLTYPVIAEAKLVFQALNFLEGKAPAWTSQEAVAFRQSVAETGLVPNGFPVREVANDGSVAWTLRREIYFLFIGLPFVGVPDFLSRMASANGPIRMAANPDLRFELRPIVIPAAFEWQTESMALWDKARTTRSFLQFSQPAAAKDGPQVKDVMAFEKVVPTALAEAEAISRDVTTAIEQIFQRTTNGDAS